MSKTKSQLLKAGSSLNSPASPQSPPPQTKIHRPLDPPRRKERLQRLRDMAHHLQGRQGLKPQAKKLKPTQSRLEISAL